MWGWERASASTTTQRRLLGTKCKMGQSRKEQAGEKPSRQRHMHRQQGEERAESSHPEHTARTHKNTIPNGADTDHKLRTTINNFPRCMLDFWLVWAWLVAMVDWWRLNNVLQTCLHYSWSPVNYLYTVFLKENKHRCVCLYFCRLQVHKGNLLYFCLSEFSNE